MSRHRRKAPPPPATLDDEFARAMRTMDVVPLEAGTLPPPEPRDQPPKPRARRIRAPLHADEIENAVAPEEAALFRHAMAGLGFGPAPSEPTASGPTDVPDEPSPQRPATDPSRQRSSQEPTARSVARPAAPRYIPEVDEASKVLFAEAMASLAHVPNKDVPRQPPDSATPAAKPRKARRIRRIQEVDATLDLHRERQTRAIERLRDFLVGAATRGADTVLVITGKGHHSENGQGVLRRAVEAWLIRNGTPWVLRFREAPRELGGSGAWLLELRR